MCLEVRPKAVRQKEGYVEMTVAIEQKKRWSGKIREKMGIFNFQVTLFPY
jgi:hypothetical protein